MTAVSITPMLAHRWHRKRHDPTKVVGCFEAPFVPAGASEDAASISLPPCSVTIVDEGRKTFGRSYLVPGSKKLPLTNAFSNVLFSACSEVGCVSIVVVLRKKSLGMLVATHAPTYPHAVVAVKDVSKDFYACCQGIASKAYELGVRRACVRATPCGVLVVVVLANAAGTTFLIRGNVDTGRWTRLELDPLQGAMPHLSIDATQQTIRVLLGRADVGAPSGVWSEGGAASSAPRDGPLAVFAVDSPSSRHRQPVAFNAGSHRQAPSVRSLQVRWDAIAWGDDAFVTTRLESGAFVPPEGSFALLAPHGQACPLHVGPTVVTVLLPMGTETVAVQLPMWEACCGRPFVHAHWTTIAQLSAPMTITRVRTRNRSDGGGILLILSEDCSLFALATLGDAIPVSVATAALDPSLPPNRLTFVNEVAPAQHPSTGAAQRLSSRVSIHPLAPEAILVSNGVMGCILRCTVVSDAAHDAAHASITLLRRASIVPRCSLLHLQHQANAWLRARCPSSTPLDVCHAMRLLVPCLASMGAHLPLHGSTALLGSVVRTAIGQMHITSLNDWIVAWMMLTWFRTKVHNIVARSSPSPFVSSNDNALGQSEHCTVHLLSCLASLNTAHALQGAKLSEAALALVRPTLSEPLQVLLTPTRSTLDDQPVSCGLVEAILCDGGILVATAERFAQQLVGTAQLSTGSWTMHTPHGSADVLQCIGVSLLCSCLDVALLLEVSAEQGVRFYSPEADASARPSTATLRVAPVVFASQAAYDYALTLSADLLCTRGTIGDALMPYPLDLLMLSLLCCGRTHAVRTAFQLFPVQWDSIFRQMLTMLENEDDAAALFAACRSCVDVDPSSLLAHVLRMRPAVDALPAMTQRTAVVLANFASASKGAPFEELRCLAEHLPVDILQFIAAVALHYEVERLVIAAQQHAVDVIKGFLPPKGSKATTPAMQAYAVACAKAVRDAAHETCATSVRRLCGVLPQARDVLGHKLLHPEARGRSLSLIQRTLERDARVVCLLSFQFAVEGALAAHANTAQHHHVPPSPPEATVDTHPAILYACAALQSYVALKGTLIPVEHIQKHCLDAVRLCLAQMLHPPNTAAGAAVAPLAAFLKEVLVLTEVARSDILSIKREACHLEDAILTVLSAQPSEAAPTAHLKEVLKQAASTPTTDERKNVRRYAGVGWHSDILNDGRHAFLINDRWLETLWPVEFFANDWFPIVESILPPAAAASFPSTSEGRVAVELSPQCRKALLATVCAIAPPLRSFQSSTATIKATTSTTGTSTLGNGERALTPQPTATATAPVGKAMPRDEAPLGPSSAIAATTNKTLVAPATSATTSAAQPSAAPQKPTPQPLSLDPVAMSANGMSVALSTATGTSVAGSPPVVMSTDKQAGPGPEQKPQPQVTTTGIDPTESAKYTAADIAWWDVATPSRPEDVVLSFNVDGAAGDASSDTSYSNATTMTSANKRKDRRATRSSSSSNSSTSSLKHKHHHGRHHHRHHRSHHRPHLCAKHSAALGPRCAPQAQTMATQPTAALHTTAQTGTGTCGAPLMGGGAHAPLLAPPVALQAPPQASATTLQPCGAAAPPASPAQLRVPTPLTLPSVTAPSVHLVDPVALVNQGRGRGGATAHPQGEALPAGGLRPPPPVAATQDRQLSAPLQPPPAPPTVFFNNGHAPPNLPFQYAGGMGFPVGLAPPQLLVAPNNTKKSRRHRKRHHKKRSSSSSTSSSSEGDAEKKKRSTQQKEQQKATAGNQGKSSQKADTMQFEDLNRLYSFLMDEVPLPPGEVMYRGANNAMKLATAPQPLQASAVLPPSEQARFQHYVDDLLLKNRSQPLTASQQGPPGQTPGSPLRGSVHTGRASSSSVNRSASHEEFLQQLAAQQHAMFQAQQEMFTQQQRENMSLVRRLADQQQQSAGGGMSYPTRSGASSPPRTSHGAASSPTRAQSGEVGASGLTAMQQAQLVEETMEYRRRVLQLSEELIKLQSRVMSSQPTPPVLHGNAAPPPLSSLRSDTAVNTSVRASGLPHSSGGSPLRGDAHHSFRSVAVGGGSNYQTQNAAAQTHGLRAATPPRPSSSAAASAYAGQQQPSPNQSLLVSRSALHDMQDELQRLTEGTNHVEKATADAVGLLQRSSMYHSASEFAIEQQAAIEALRKKAASVQSQLLLQHQSSTAGGYNSGRLGTAPLMHDDQGAFDMVRMTSTLVEPHQQASPTAGGGPRRQWVSESEGGYQPQQQEQIQQGQSAADGDGRMWSTVSEGVLPAVEDGADHRLPPPSRGRTFEDVSVTAAEFNSSPRRPASTRGAQPTVSSFSVPPGQHLLHSSALQASGAHHPSSPKRDTAATSVSFQAKSPTRTSQGNTDGSRRGAWEPMLPAHGEAPSMRQSFYHGGGGGGNNLGAMYHQAAAGGTNNTLSNISAMQRQPPHERSTSATAKRSQSKEKTTTPDNLKMYASSHPSKKVTDRPTAHRTASASPPSRTKATESCSTQAGHGAAPAAAHASHASGGNDASTNVLKGKRSLDIGDKFAEKQRRLLAEHTKARIAAVKRALS